MGRLVNGTGDVNGDSLSDLVFLKSINATTWTLTTILGNRLLPRDLNGLMGVNSDPDRVRWYSQNITVTSGVTPTAEILDWNGVLDTTTGRATSELLINKGVESSIHSYIHNTNAQALLGLP